MKILVVSGCLGSGKTTFIQTLAKRTGKDFVVYENEFGEADIDAQKLRVDAELEVWESTENCICCSGKQDFASSILTIYNTLNPEYLVVEPTGVAKLASVIQNIESIRYADMEILPPLTIIDAFAWQKSKSRMPQIFLDQLKSASTLVISKGSSTIDTDLAALIQQENPGAQLVSGPWDQHDTDFFMSLLTGEMTADLAESSEGEDELFETFSLKHVELANPTQAIVFLDDLVRGVFGDVLRAKGTITLPKNALRFDVVDGMWALSEADAADKEVAVFIGNALDKNHLRKRIVPVQWHEVAEIKHEHHHEHDHDHGHHHHHKD